MTDHSEVSTEGPASDMPAVQVRGLSRRFGRNEVLRQVDLSVPRGTVYGLVGENGAGKTTLIRHLLGLLKAQAGTVRIFGMDPVRDPVGVLSRIGYLSEDRDLPEWMNVEETIRYSRAFYPGWDTPYADGLRERFSLDPRARVKSLSRGQKAKLGLLLALAHRPDLLLLDEPSSGLDPIVRREILEAIIRTVADEGRTVVFSSHILDEVERVCDRTAMIVEGRVVLEGALDDIKASHHSLTLRFASPQTAPPVLADCSAVAGDEREWIFVCNGQVEALKREASDSHVELVDERGATLDEIFVARCAGSRSGKAKEALR